MVAAVLTYFHPATMPVPLALLMLLPGVPSLLDLAKIVGLPLLMLLTARFITRRDKARDEATALLAKAGQETSNERKVWREARLAAEKTNADAITKEHADRIFWQLENAADWARVVKILTEFADVQRQIAVMATTTTHHGAEIQRLHQRLEENAKHLAEFILRHVRPSA